MLLSYDDLLIFQEKCNDNAVSIRKQAICSLIKFIDLFPTNTYLQNICLNSILPLIMDSVNYFLIFIFNNIFLKESSIQEKCLDFTKQILFQKILEIK